MLQRAAPGRAGTELYEACDENGLLVWPDFVPALGNAAAGPADPDRPWWSPGGSPCA